MPMQLLADDPVLRRFKSHNKTVRFVKRMGEVLTVIVVTGMLVLVKIQVQKITIVLILLRLRI